MADIGRKRYRRVIRRQHKKNAGTSFEQICISIMRNDGGNIELAIIEPTGTYLKLHLTIKNISVRDS